MKFKHIFLLSLLFLISSCKITLVPSYNPDAVAKVAAASSATDNLYDGIITSNDKSFIGHAVEYDVVSGQINDILVLDSTRKKSGVILIIGNDIKNRFAKYENTHKSAGSLTNPELKTLKDYMHALWETLGNAEKNFKP